jgi:membrane protein DedA with SNARE-associated domain/rhodanese-related sulfurtransferase
MHGVTHFLHHYGRSVVFGAALLEQSGLPFPATPVFVAAGVAVGAGDLHHGPTIFGLAVAGSLLGDLFWYGLGRWRGQQVLKLLCRMTLEPDSCARDTEDRFLKWGSPSLIYAKFLPGIGTVIRPLAAVAGVGTGTFLGYDALGTVLYIGAFMGLGYFFSDQANGLLATAASVGRALIEILLAGLALYIFVKLYRRRQFLRRLPSTRLAAEELKRRIDAGLAPVIVDLRTPLQMKAFPYSIPGALKIPLQSFEKGAAVLPTGRDVVLFCDCPNEVSSAKAAMLLQRKGVMNAWALTRGIESWKELHYPLEAMAIVL